MGASTFSLNFFINRLQEHCQMNTKETEYNPA